MSISRDYAVLSKDRKTIALPDDVQRRLKDEERFVVLFEDDSIILKKAHTRKTLDELVARRDAPVSERELDALIHEARK